MAATMMPRVGGGGRPAGGAAYTFTAGRPPWYDRNGEVKHAFIIGVAGGSASGKTTVAERIMQKLNVPWVALISMDSFYKPLTPMQLQSAHENNYDFDVPDAFDYPLMIETITQIKRGRQVEVPVYDFKTHSRSKETRTIYGANVVVFEGILTLHDPTLTALMDMRIFVDTDDDVRLARRLDRDISERGRDIHGVLAQYERFVKPSFERYIRPSIRHADVIVPRGGDNTVAIDLIAKHIHRMLEERGFHFRSELATIDGRTGIPASVHVMPPTPQRKVMHTMIRDRAASRDDFIFYSQRLFRLLIEEGLSVLPFEGCDVVTPTGATYHGVRQANDIVGVSIVRAGVTLENALQDVQKDIRIGKILIQSDPRTAEPQLHYFSLPSALTKSRVLLLDATIATGAAALMAIRVLLDHDVAEENIVLLALLAAPQGLNAVAQTYPKVRIVVSEVDAGLNSAFHIVPGIGNFGDRFYGT